MCSKSIAAFVLVFAGAVSLHAFEHKTPYKAIVENEGEYVRCGPAMKFYPTDKLRKGDRVTVIRHDPGGWAMITPPEGSFSWIRAEHVKKSGPDSGILQQNNVVVHVGSLLNETELSVVQGSLSNGDAVHILGEKLIPFEDGHKLMYKIKPHRREYRWIQTKGILPADAIKPEFFPVESAPRKRPSGPIAEREVVVEQYEEIERTASNSDPFKQAIPTGTSESLPNSRSGSNRGSSAKQVPVEAESSAFKSRLIDVDRQFHAMIKLEPSQWELPEIREQYLSLENDASLPAQSDLIAGRLDTVSRYEKTRTDYMSFLKLAEELRQKDAKLAAIQQQSEEKLRALEGMAQTPTPNLQAQETPSNGTPTQTVSVGSTDPIPDPEAGPAPAPASAAAAGAMPKFAGAGLVTPMAKTFPGGPQYALIAPNGKLLAYLVPVQGMDLRRVGNQSVGIVGDRSFRQDWGADAIVVRAVQPVKLRSNH